MCGDGVASFLNATLTAGRGVFFVDRKQERRKTPTKIINKTTEIMVMEMYAKATRSDAMMLFGAEHPSKERARGVPVYRSRVQETHVTLTLGTERF